MNYKQFIGTKTPLNSRKWGKLEIESASFTPAIDGDLVVYMGNPIPESVPYVRIHSECVFAEAFDSDFCDCADQLTIAMERLSKEQNSILFYLRFDGRGTGLSAKVAATKLEMVEGLDTFESHEHLGIPPECRDFTAIGNYLLEKGFYKIHLLTNNPEKAEDVRRAGVEVITEPLYVENPNVNVQKLYQTKMEKFSHSISLDFDK